MIYRFPALRGYSLGLLASVIYGMGTRVFRGAL